MIKKILLVLWAIVTVFFIVLSQIQKAEAEKQAAAAELLREEAVELKKQAEKASGDARRLAAEARRQESIALNEMKAADIEREKARELLKKLENCN